MDQVVIRKAKRQDCKEIMRLIHELAEFEKLPDHVKIVTSDLERDGFDTDNPRFGCYVAEMTTVGKEPCKGDSARSFHKNAAEPGEAGLVGFALYYQTYSTWDGVSLFLEDLYVSPQCRQQGLGRALFARVAKECVSMGGKRLDFEVLNWNPARKFYEKLGAVNRTESGGWLSYRVAEEALENLGSCIAH